MICQLAAFHSPADMQIIVVSAAPDRMGMGEVASAYAASRERDGCGERRLLFSSPAELEDFVDERNAERTEWTSSGQWPARRCRTPALPLRVIIDDDCGTPEDWAGLTGSAGYAGTCFIRLAPRCRVPPPDTFGAKLGGLRSGDHLPAGRRGVAQTAADRRSGAFGGIRWAPTNSTRPSTPPPTR